MPYIVNNSDGSLTVTVADNTVDTSTYSLALIGRNVSNYGQFFAQNTIRHLENFASTAQPNPAQSLVGQQWYDKSENIMRVFDGNIWKRSTNIVVGESSARPASGLGSGGAAFLNQSNSKLEVHDGTGWIEAGYAGEVTNRYSSDTAVQSPSLYGARVRTLFLKEAGAQRWHPVLALSYVKSTSDTSTSANQGATDIGGQRETIMSLWSDVDFIVDSNTQTPVDGQTVNFYSELTAGGVGIASDRFGRSVGQIIKGMNTRAEYEDTDVAVFSDVFVTNSLGGQSDPVPVGYFQDINVQGVLTAQGTAEFKSDIELDGNFVAGGDISAVTGTGTFAALNITGDSTFGGNVVFNGAVVFNDTTPLEGDDANFTGNVSIGNLSVTGDTDLQNLLVNGTTTLQGITTVNANTTINANLTTNGDITATGEIETVGLRVTGSAVFSENITAPQFSGTFIGNLTGDVTGDLTGNVSGDVTGNLTGDVTGDLTGNVNGNVTGNLTGNVTGDVTGNVTGDVTGDVSGDVTGNLTGNVTGDVTGDVTGNLTGNVTGTASQATYADLAEKYVADLDYTPGTVVILGGEKEITQSTQAQDAEVFGVISTDPAYLMNSAIDGLPVAMTGRVPVLVTGKIKRGQRLTTSDVPGHAQALDPEQYDPRIVIGRALEDHDSASNGVIEAVIGVK